MLERDLLRAGLTQERGRPQRRCRRKSKTSAQNARQRGGSPQTHPGEKQWGICQLLSFCRRWGVVTGGGRVLGVGDQSNKPADVLTSSSMSAFVPG